MMTGSNLGPLCQHCGQALTEFLQEMEKHNANVVCPTCGKTQTGSTKKTGDSRVHDHPRHSNPLADGNVKKRNQPAVSGKH